MNWKGANDIWYFSMLKKAEKRKWLRVNDPLFPSISFPMKGIYLKLLSTSSIKSIREFNYVKPFEGSRKIYFPGTSKKNWLVCLNAPKFLIILFPSLNLNGREKFQNSNQGAKVYWENSIQSNYLMKIATINFLR